MIRIPHDALRRLSQSGGFDPDWYLETYPDVGETGMDPAEHFLWVGARLGRRPGPSRSRGHSRASLQCFDAFFIDGTNGTASTSYRVDLVAEGLVGLGWKTGSCRLDQLEDVLAAGDFASRFVIIHRAYDYQAMRGILADFRSQGSIIIYDVDDLVFDVEALPFVDAYSHMPEAQKRAFERSFADVRDFVLNADFCTTSTDFLVGRLNALGKRAYRVRNSISSRIIDDFSRVAVRHGSMPNPFVVGYYSGTKTHQADFAVAAPALISFMEKHEDVVFRLVGKLDLREYPQLAAWQRPSGGKAPRVVTVSLMPHRAMLRDQLTCEVIIAPLEVGNPFCEAKSELKFFEAALAKCPMIAAATQTFVEATEGGRLALLARETQDWEDALEAIYQDYLAALERAEEAFYGICARYSQAAAAAEAMAAYRDFEGCSADVQASEGSYKAPV